MNALILTTLMLGAISYEQAMERYAHGRPMLVMVSADWCGPCQQIKRNTLPKLERAGDLRGISLVVLNVDVDRTHSGRIINEAQARGIPVLALYWSEDGEPKAKYHVGFIDDKDLREFISVVRD